MHKRDEAMKNENSFVMTCFDVGDGVNQVLLFIYKL